MKLIDADKLVAALETSVENAERDYRLTEGHMEGALARGRIVTLKDVLNAVKDAVDE